MPPPRAADRDRVTTSGDTQALPRIAVPGVAVGAPIPTVALTLAPSVERTPAVAPEPGRAPVEEVPTATAEEPAAMPAEPAVEAGPEAPAESHERIYEEAMATIAELASNWTVEVQRTTGRHRAAA